MACGGQAAPAGLGGVARVYGVHGGGHQAEEPAAAAVLPPAAAHGQAPGPSPWGHSCLAAQQGAPRRTQTSAHWRRGAPRPALLPQVVDAALASAPRLVLFSSFDPEVCTELKRRRPAFPVMFLSGGGAYPHVDARRTSVAAAVEFAAGAGLDGIILETDHLRAEAHMIAEARARGLQVMTYGQVRCGAAWRGVARVGVGRAGGRWALRVRLPGARR